MNRQPSKVESPLICLITDRRSLQVHAGQPEEDLLDGLVEQARIAASSGCQLIQIREKDLAAGALLSLTRRVIEAARGYGARVLVNDRLDVALAAGADGVHLPASSLPPAEARAIADRAGLPDFVIGVSTHSLEDALAAESGRADFIVTGPVFETPSKATYGPPMGLERLGEICSRIRIPVLALGGITPENFDRPLRAGAAGIAGIGIFSDPANLSVEVRRILDFND